MARQQSQSSAEGSTLPERIERALAAQRFFEAIHLGQQLLEEDRSEAAQNLVREAYRRQIAELVRKHQVREGMVTLNAAARLEREEPGWLRELALWHAQLGNVSGAIELVDRLGDEAVWSEVMGTLVDQLLVQTRPEPERLPAALQPDFARVRQAFEHYQAGRDDAVKEALREIPARSLFADWRLLLRGLTARASGEPAWATEHFQRLQPNRLPYRLVQLIHPSEEEGAASNPTSGNASRQRLARRLQPNFELIQGLQRVETAIQQRDTLQPAFAKCARLVSQFRESYPAEIQRLAQVMYWTIGQRGRPEDLRRFTRVFGPLPEDPQFARLEAVILEGTEQFEQAHERWQQYERFIASHLDRWPEEQGKLARAMIWLRMGENAVTCEPEESEQEESFTSWWNETFRPPPLSPDARTCFRTAMELAPDWVEPAVAFVRHCLNADDLAPIGPYVVDLTQRFPDHLMLISQLAVYHQRLGELDQAVDLLQRAERINPFDQALRQRLGRTLVAQARSQAVQKAFDTARQTLEAATPLLPGDTDRRLLLCCRAVLALKEGDSETFTQLREQALEAPERRHEANYRLMVEANQMNLPRGVRGSIDQSYKETTAASLTWAEIVPLLAAFAGYRQEAAVYRGAKSHEQKLRVSLNKLLKNKKNLDEHALVWVCSLALELRWLNLARDCINLGEKKFPANPHFPYYQAVRFLNHTRRSRYHIERALKAAQNKAQQQPRSPEMEALLAQINERFEELEIKSPDPFRLLTLMKIMTEEGRED